MEDRHTARPIDDLAPAPITAASGRISPRANAPSARSPKENQQDKAEGLDAVATVLRTAGVLAVEARGLAARRTLVLSHNGISAREGASDVLGVALSVALPSLARATIEGPLLDGKIELARIVGGSTESLTRAVYASGPTPPDTTTNPAVQ